MEKIREWALLLVFISIASLIYYFLLPSGNISKTAKSVISVLALCAVCIPLFEAFGDFDTADFGFNAQEAPEPSVPYDYYMKSSEQAVKELISEVIKKYTSVPFETELDININEDNCIIIEHVRIIFSAVPQQEKQLREALFEALGILPEIKVETTDE